MRGLPDLKDVTLINVINRLCFHEYNKNLPRINSRSRKDEQLNWQKNAAEAALYVYLLIKRIV
jgi:hypothetical protein